MFMNPFIEGVVLVVLGVALTIVSKVWNVPDLDASGKIILGIGIGYFGKSAVEKQASNGGK